MRADQLSLCGRNWGARFRLRSLLLLAGVSFALVTDKLHQRGTPVQQIASTTIRRGAEVFGLGLLLRVQEYVLAWGWSPWTDLFRVDILNTIGLSMILMGLVCWAVPARSRNGPTRFIVAATALLVGFGISLLTPLIWTSWRTRRPPWPLETYINGVHNLGEPQPWLFPIFHGQGLPSSGWRWDSCC